MQQKKRSWFPLIAFFVTMTLGWSLVLGAIFAGATVVIAGGEPSSSEPQSHEGQAGVRAANQTFSGVITDAHCGPKHSDSDKGPSECARMCVRNGSKYNIVDGDKKYDVAGNLAQFDEFAGQRVRLFGSLEGNTIKVVSINPGTLAEVAQR